MLRVVERMICGGMAAAFDTWRDHVDECCEVFIATCARSCARMVYMVCLSGGFAGWDICPSVNYGCKPATDILLDARPH